MWAGQSPEPEQGPELIPGQGSEPGPGPEPEQGQEPGLRGSEVPSCTSDDDAGISHGCLLLIVWGEGGAG